MQGYDRMIRTTCPSCGAGCGLKVFLKDGKAVEIYGDEENQLNKGSICSRGLSSLFHLYHDKRLLQPLLRNKLSEEFRQVTWAEALDHVAEKLRTLGQRFSPESAYFHLTSHSGFGNVVLGKIFGELFGTPNVEEDLSPESSPAGVVLQHMLGIQANGCAMSSRHEWSSSRAMLLVGVDPAVTDPVAFGPILDAKDRGTQLIVLDSRNTITMGKAHISLKSRVGTEQTVLLSLAHVILREHLYNDEFLKQWVDGLEDFVALCEEYPPAEVEGISGVKEEDILLAARTFALNFPSMVIGVSRVSSRFTSAGLVFGMASLAAITGSIGCPGGGLSLFYNFPPLEPLIEGTEKPSIEKTNLAKVGMGSSIWRAIVEDKPYPIRAIIWDGNALQFAPRAAQVRESLKKMDLIIHLGQYPNITYHHSHVVFPITSFLETEGLVFASVGRNLQWANRVVELRGECRPADDFWGGLMQRFGLSSSFPFIDGDGKVNIREMTRHFLSANPLTSGITPELLDPETNPPGGIQWPIDSDGEADFPSHRAAVRGREDLFRPETRFPGSEKRFPTPSGRVRISPREIAEEKGFQMFGWFQGLAGAGSRKRGSLKGNRFMLVVGELVDYLPSAGFWALPQKPRKPLFIQIHPKRARELGIDNGEIIVVENDIGRIEAPAWVTDHVDEETIFYPLGADPYDPTNPFECGCGLMDFVAENENCGRRYLEAALVKVRKDS
jgi:anaerobic selenocysteine-containing dehydrogenase